MQHPYEVLRSEYSRRLASMKITRRSAVDADAKRLLTPAIFDRHLEIEQITKTPAIFLATVFDREASSNFRLALGQGDPWNRVSVNVPRGKGPFKSWKDAALFYIEYDHLNVFTAPLDMEYLCWKGEAWNGFGPRNHGRPTGYLWSGTNQYDPPAGPGGKYVADGVWSSGTVDQQLGIIPVMARMLELRPELDDRFAVQFNPAIKPPEEVTETPVGVGGGPRDTAWIQTTLNKIGERPALLVDNNYGRMTRAAVRRFQSVHGLEQDGLVGPKTIAALEKAIAGLQAAEK